MERPSTHALHGIMLAILAYFAMTMIMKQSASVAERRSVMLGAVSTLYMLMYGHSVPKL